MVACSVEIRPAAGARMNVSTTATDLSDTLPGRRELTAQTLDFARHNCWKLRKRIAGLGQLVLPRRELLVQQVQVLLLLEKRHSPTLEVGVRHVAFFFEFGGGRDKL